MIRSASRENGIVCSSTRPGPESVAKNSPSPPNSAVLMPGTILMSYRTCCSIATMQPVSTRSVSLDINVVS
jgi:hypothetical protein